ncbi:MAG TPA: heme-binding protein, partial [Burkholderiales bacterium]|nr:heme-binding protein [Burkholderiales bacterium]
MSLKIVLGFSLAAFATVAAAQGRPDYGPSINLATAKKVAAATLAECQKNKWNVAVAVVDTHGSLLYFERLENTQYASNDVAIGKARAAA